MSIIKEVRHGYVFPAAVLLFVTCFAVKAPILNWETYFRLNSDSIRKSS